MNISSASFRGLCTAMLLVIAGALAGCSSAPRREAQWIDPSLGPQSRLMQGEKVLIACDAYDPAVRQICQERLFRELQAKGATPLLVPPGTTLLIDRELDSQLVASAAALGAKTVFVMSLAPATTSGGSGLSLGIGAFSFGGGGGGGIGLSAPIGAGQGNTGFAANGRVTDVRSSRLVWTASLVAAPSADLDAQFAALSRAMLDAAQGAGLF